MDEEGVRVTFLESNDLAFNYMVHKANVLLRDSFSRESFEPRTINNALELHECWRLYNEIKPEMVKDHGWYKEFATIARSANSAAMIFISRYFNHNDLAEAVNEIDSQLINALFCLLTSSGILKTIREDDFETTLTSNPWLLKTALQYKSIINQFGKAIRKAMLANKTTSAEVILDSTVLASHTGSTCDLQKCLTSSDVTAILDEYCDSDMPHINKLQAISNWKEYGGFSLAPKLKYKAAKRADALNHVLFDNNSASIATGVCTVINPNQKVCIKADICGLNVTYSFGGKWLEKTIDEASILTNLIHIFNLIDSAGRIELAKPDHSVSSFMKTIVIRGKYDFWPGYSFRIKEMTLSGSIAAYEGFLLKNGRSLERAMDWFFNAYIEKEFGVSGFRSDMPNPDLPIVQKCNSISSEIERIVKEYNLYARDGVIDYELFKFEQFPPFEQIHSLITDKYAYGCGKDYERLAFLMFSDQCMLKNLLGQDSTYDCFFDLISHQSISREDYAGHRLATELDWLFEKKFLYSDAVGKIALTNRGKTAYLLWRDGTLPVLNCTNEIYSTLIQGLKENWIEFNSSLLSKSEADIFNYFLTDRKFANSMAIRNKYAHGAPPAKDPDSDEFRQDYIYLLMFALFLLLKINDELSMATKKVGQLEFVDWPLFEVRKELCDLPYQHLTS